MYLLSQFIFLLSCCASFTIAVRRLDKTPIERQRYLEDLDLLKEDFNSNSNSNFKSTNRREKQKQVLPTPEDHLVTSLPYLPAYSFPTKHFAGHLPASADGEKQLFYWLFEPDGIEESPSSRSNSGSHDEKVPLLIWLNGGPGCSSMDGLFLENGPFRLLPPKKSEDKNDDWTIEINPHSWHNAPAYVLYIDQPVGTGLSFTEDKNFCKSDLEINIDFHYFLQSFLTVYADFFLTDVHGDDKASPRTMKRTLYFSGESHAGHYIPSMMDYILQRNNDHATDPRTGITIDLGGAAIGNGWMDPYHQYMASEYAYGIGLIDAAQRRGVSADEEACRAKLAIGHLHESVCTNLIDTIVSSAYGDGGRTRINSYDTRKVEPGNAARTFPPGHTDVEAYLGGWREGFKYAGDMDVPYEDVLRALHAEGSIAAGQRYKECTDPPYYALAHQDGLGVVEELVRVLEHPRKPRMLFFNGMADLVCHHVGNERVLLNLPWRFRDEWITADRYAWFPSGGGGDDGGDGAPAGFMKEFDNLMFLKVRESGHMVPLDLPVTSLHMMRLFLFSGSFKSRKQKLYSQIPNLGNKTSSGSSASNRLVCNNSSGLSTFLGALFGIGVGLVAAWISYKILPCRSWGSDHKAVGSQGIDLVKDTASYKDRTPFRDHSESSESNEDDEMSSAVII